ncbi:MAG: uroporphyrinogen-III synthase [Alphaproteobacteria bacterium]|nr:uroporphyrinogen-III synthase [Alphaproteobacteria bacterium]
MLAVPYAQWFLLAFYRISMTILITRANEHAYATQKDVEARGFATLIDPMLDIEQLANPAPISPTIAAFIITSRNALQGFKTIAQKNIPLFIVGKETAELFKQAGFANIHGIAEQGSELPALIKTTIPAGNLLHITSQHAHTDFYDALLDAGYGIEQRLVYIAHAARAFQPETLKALQNKQLTGVLFYSARTAQIFSGLIAQQSLAESLRTITAYCLSDAIADALHKQQWKHVVVAKSPTHVALIDCLAKAA